MGFLLSYNTLTSAASLSTSTSGLQPGVDYTFSAYMNTGTQWLTVNNRTVSGTKSTAINNQDTTLYLFARHAPDKANEVDNQMKIELDWFRVSKKGVPFLDLRPAVSRDGEACLYDSVGNRLFKNIGTAPFTAGMRTVDAGIEYGSTETRCAAPLVDVASQTAQTVTLAFAAGAAGELYVASGPFDAGDERRNWTAFTHLATITANAANWACTNAAGMAVEGGLPSASSIVHLAGEIADFSLPAGTDFPRAAFEVGACTLAGDCDLSGVPGVAFDSTIDLKGHVLTISTLLGAGTITDTVGDTLSFASGAKIEVDVHGRRFASEEDRRLIAWNEPPDVQFVPSASTRAEGRALEIRQDGLYVRGGLAIILR